MTSFLKESQDLKIPFKDVELATRNFTTIIGQGGYGTVYKGELILSGKLTSVAVKRLPTSNQNGQGRKQFLTEIQLLSRYKHPNLVSLIGYCEEGKEKILIYEYAENGSLDRYLSPTRQLTWNQRINICLGAARGLDYLHNHFAENQRVIHRDIKSANILLDQNWRAMISDFGLSKLGRANENDTFIITNVGGTFGYCDPEYRRTGVLTKESDVYSFGVVLFEALCGRLCFINVNHESRFLSSLAPRYYENRRLNEIIDPYLKDQLDSDSLNRFSKIAYQCLQNDRKKRPSMGMVVEELEEALLESQDIDGLPIDLEVISRMSDSYHAYTSTEELYKHLSKGILVSGRKVWFSIDDKGNNQEMISAMKFMHGHRRNCTMTSAPESRFPVVAKILDASKVNMQVKIRTWFLSSGVTYAAYLVFKSTYVRSKVFSHMVGLKYKLNDTSQSCIAYVGELKDDGWMMIELFQTVNLRRNVEFEVTLEGFEFLPKKTNVIVEGIKFLPMEKFGDQELIKKPDVDDLVIFDKIYENHLPGDYNQFIYYSSKELLKLPQDYAIFPSKVEAYSILSVGVRMKVDNDIDII